MAAREYALYQGEEVLCIGTIQEIAVKRGIKRNTVKFYGSAAYKEQSAGYKNAMVLIEIDD